MTASPPPDIALYWNEVLAEDLLRFLTGRIKCQEAAADLAQETFLRFHQFIQATPPNYARALAFSIAVNLATDYQRKAKVRSNHMVESDQNLLTETHASTAPGPEQIAISQQRLKQFHDALDELPTNYRSAFLLHNIDGLTYAEVAACLGVAESTVYKYLAKTIIHCRNRLGDTD
ncbi:MAG: RNA polymerase sigma factor [Methyloglobulus sp.]|nr:RNA polymerase sigma factor [Methyloglobulus sp.]